MIVVVVVVVDWKTLLISRSRQAKWRFHKLNGIITCKSAKRTPLNSYKPPGAIKRSNTGDVLYNNLLASSIGVVVLCRVVLCCIMSCIFACLSDLDYIFYEWLLLLNFLYTMALSNGFYCFLTVSSIRTVSHGRMMTSDQMYQMCRYMWHTICMWRYQYTMYIYIYINIYRV